MSEYLYHGYPLPKKAVDLAYAADDVFNNRLTAAKSLAEAVASGDKVSEEAAKEKYSVLDETFNTFISAAASLMPPRAAFEASEAETERSQKVIDKTVSPWDILKDCDPEKAERAAQARIALAEKYVRPVEDFSLVQTTRETEDGKHEIVYTVVLTSTDGVDLGKPGEYDEKRSWKAIDPTRKNKDHELRVWGKTIDVRKAQSLEVLAKVAKINPKINECVWETASPYLARTGFAPFVGLFRGRAMRGFDRRDYGGWGARFRPAVEIE